MKFSSDSKNLVIAYSQESDYEIQIIKIDETGAFGEATFTGNTDITDIRHVDVND